MFRLLYLCLLRLHPARFRRRFGEEMLWIFDKTAGERSVIPLLADGFLSLVRQWVLRAESSERPREPQPTLDGVPVFFTFKTSAPALSTLMNGGILSLAAFAAVSFGFFYGRTHEPPRRTLFAGFSDTGRSPAFAMPGLAASASTSSSPTPPARPALAGSRSGDSLPAFVAAAPDALSPPTEQPASSAPIRTRTFFPVRVPEELLRTYAGTYLAEPAGNLRVQVILEDGALFLSFAEQQKTALVAITATQFCPRGVSAEWVEFRTDAYGRVTGLTIHQGGRQVQARRLEPGEH